MAECIGVPASELSQILPIPCILTGVHIEKFETRDLKWAPDGKGLMLLDKDMFCCAFEVQEEGDQS
jgi:hypothetical protein